MLLWELFVGGSLQTARLPWLISSTQQKKKGVSFCFSEITRLYPNLDSSLCFKCTVLASVSGLALLPSATRGSRGPSEIQLGAAWELGLTEMVHQAPINAPVQSQMEQTNSALPLTIQITPLGTLGSRAL